MIESPLDEALVAIGIDFRPLMTLITYVVVDKDDPAFKTPLNRLARITPQNKQLASRIHC